jgi:hypothetical protein
MGNEDKDVIDYDNYNEDGDQDNEDDDDGNDNQDDDDKNTTINCWQQLGRRIQEKETMTMTMMTTTTMTTMTTTMMTKTVNTTTMNTTTTKQQSTVLGNNRGSRIGEKTTTSLRCETTEEGHGGGDLVEYF